MFNNTIFFFLPDILQCNFKPDYYLKHIQKDLRLAISMGDTANHPTPMAAAANEVPHYTIMIFHHFLFRPVLVFHICHVILLSGILLLIVGFLKGISGLTTA